MATLGLSKVFILDKYFTELQKFWETEKKLQDAVSSNEAVTLQRRLLSLSSELVTLRNHLHVQGQGQGQGPGPAQGASQAQAQGPGHGQPAVPPRAPSHHAPSVAPPPPHPPQLAEARWRGGSGGGGGALQGPLPGTASVSGAQDVEDLIHLRGPLTEDAVVRALQHRFYQNKFYTWVGPILLAVNGYTDTGNALTLAAARASPSAGNGTGSGSGVEGCQLARLVRGAVRAQSESGCPQAVILSGAAGAGKTYASMVLLRRLFELAGGGAETDAFKHLAAAFCVLRALGSAATAANAHSSRVGHFIEVQVTDGALYRTKIHCYFLDQTRVVRVPPHERNYHIFYLMLGGLAAEERAALRLEGLGPKELRYLAAAAPRRPEPEDAARFLAWKSCLGVLGIPPADVLRVLAAVLLLGNVVFAEGAGGAAEADPRPDGELGAAAALLGVPAAALARGLGVRAARAGAGAGGAARAPATAAAAAAARDALAKALYARTVATIVRRANSLKRAGSGSGCGSRPGAASGTLSSGSADSLRCDEASLSASGASGASSRRQQRGRAALSDAVRHATDGFVGILDMFGFEDAAPSRLEQLCANLCAETMQHFYNTHVFKSAAESCREEGVADEGAFEYADNVPVIDLVSSLRGGLLAALDAECALGARGSPEGYVLRVRNAHRAHPRLLEARPPHARRFVVRHYAGDVTYAADHFLEANRDAVPDELLQAFDPRACDFGFATHLFGGELRALAARSQQPQGSAAGPGAGATFRASPSAGAGAAPSTLTQDFHTRLDNLLRTLVHARPHFVRCVRANAAEAPLLFERAVVVRQLRALQVLETAQLMATGYPHRMRFRAFAARYRALWPARRAHSGSGAARDGPSACARVLRAVRAAAAPPAPLSPAAVRWAVGATRHVFLSEGMRQVLERMRRARRHAAAARVQAAWRAHRARRAAQPLPGPARAPARPRPAPIAGTPPPEPPPAPLQAPLQADEDKCDPALVKRACSLFGLDLEVPPPLPPARAYTVAGGVKLGYPQLRRVAADWAGGGLRLRQGDAVTALGAAGRRGHVLVAGPLGGPVPVPHRVLGPPAPAPAPPPAPRARPARPAPPPPPAPAVA